MYAHLLRRSPWDEPLHRAAPVPTSFPHCSIAPLRRLGGFLVAADLAEHACARLDERLPRRRGDCGTPFRLVAAVHCVHWVVSLVDRLLESLLRQPECRYHALSPRALEEVWQRGLRGSAAIALVWHPARSGAAAGTALEDNVAQAIDPRDCLDAQTVRARAAARAIRPRRLSTRDRRIRA